MKTFWVIAYYTGEKPGLQWSWTGTGDNFMQSFATQAEAEEFVRVDRERSFYGPDTYKIIDISSRL